MKLTERIVDSTTGLKMKSGSIVEIHIIQAESGEKSLMISDENGSLTLDQDDIDSFVDFFGKFLESF
ncbi:MAG: hypothetical protein KAT16_07485 [Candidatus Heimdallarchaeota archaeon]|nr:hypothetical protein [Candidatus Heimdallarchaeota archaeon]